MNSSLDQADLTSRLATDLRTPLRDHRMTNYSLESISALALIGFQACSAELRKFACLQYFYPCNLYDMGNGTLDGEFFSG